MKGKEISKSNESLNSNLIFLFFILLALKVTAVLILQNQY